ncbi:MAG: hypothetical protein EXQ84_07270 [Rhodospirillaceae bacterium]|nr:hypothetical protein [Rhodospirillaceae bacterium]
MILVFKDQPPPERGQFIREKRLSAPYRILLPGARVSNEQSPRRLNVELDDGNRITGLYCG